MIENNENNAKVKEVPLIFFACLDGNRVKLLRFGIPDKFYLLSLCDISPTLINFSREIKGGAKSAIKKRLKYEDWLKTMAG